MKKFLAVVGICGVLSGCMTPEQQAALQARQQAEAKQRTEEFEKQKRDYCVQRGGKVKSKKYNACMANLEKAIAAHLQQQTAIQQEEQQQQAIRDRCDAIWTAVYFQPSGMMRTSPERAALAKQDCLNQAAALRSGDTQSYYQQKQLEYQRRQMELQEQQIQLQQQQRMSPATSMCDIDRAGRLTCHHF
jgi:hypothetical protein